VAVAAPPLTSLAAAALHVAPAPERVLEIDCRDGDGALFLAREFPRARVRGVDPSERMIREATARVGLDPEGRIAFKVGDAASLPYPDDFFDLVTQIDTRPSAAEIARVLHPGGHIIVATRRDPRTLFGMRPQRMRRRLERHGIDPVHTGEAGDGSFLVGRLRGGDRAAASI
jgi:ubiquinone/menaquinone biosynthesis C-methylase UbiE